MLLTVIAQATLAPRDPRGGARPDDTAPSGVIRIFHRQQPVMQAVCGENRVQQAGTITSRVAEGNLTPPLSQNRT